MKIAIVKTTDIGLIACFYLKIKFTLKMFLEIIKENS